MKVSRTSIAKAIEACLIPGVRKATVFQDPKFVVKATHRHKPRANERSTELVLTFGAPNYSERQFIKRCVKVFVPFPVKAAQLKWYPNPRKSA